MANDITEKTLQQAHDNESPYAKIPPDQKYTLHGRIKADFAKYLKGIDWDDPGHWNLFTDKKERANHEYSEKLKGIGYTHSNTEMQQKIMKDDYDPGESFFLKCASATRLKDVDFIVCKQPPGNMTPWHQDFCASYRERHNLDVSDDECYNIIKRFWMPLEDWKIGHFYQSNNTVLWGWKAGDLYTGPGNTPHLAASAGTEPRYFAQITGCVENGDYLGKDGFETIIIN